MVRSFPLLCWSIIQGRRLLRHSFTVHSLHFYTKNKEATHAYIKLHPNFSRTNPLTLKVEEGLAQLVAHLFLNDGLDSIAKLQSSYRHLSTISSSTRTTSNDDDGVDDIIVGEDDKGFDVGGGIGDDSIPSDEKLRQYFRFCIETDDGVYGEGFRLAARAYAEMGIQELLYYVALHRDFPRAPGPL